MRLMPLTCGVWISLSCAIVVLHDVVTGALLDINPLVTLISRDCERSGKALFSHVFIPNSGNELLKLLSAVKRPEEGV